MATVEATQTGWNRAETERRVRHPLQTLRGYIRRYVVLEGMLNAVIYAALAFWLGLAFDYGLFKLSGGFDWIEELHAASQDQPADRIVRAVILGLVIAGLVAVVSLKILLRLFREFREPALALVLERRFPKELGDRLITAVEMADPQKSAALGYSQPLVDRTIADAADRIERLPVSDVFNWRRLKNLGLIALALTLGCYLLVGAGYLATSAVLGESVSPEDYFWRFNHTAVTWVERNLLLRDSYWPRQAYLELIHFQDTPQHAGEMRIGRDEQRPDLQVRAYRWVVFAHSFWRPLRWSDLHRFLDAELIQSVAIPDDWSGWSKDADGPKTNWKTWTLDKIALEEKTGEVRRRLRVDLPQAHKALEQVLGKLGELAASARMERSIRLLEIPEDIQFLYWGKSTKNSTGPDPGRTRGNDFYFNLADLKESVQFVVRGADFSTPVKRIKLVPPPSIAVLSMDKEEPAYIYYRLQGDQKPLRGKHQVFRDVPLSITGEVSTIQVPFGTTLTLTAKADRTLQEGVRMQRPAQAEERGALLPENAVTLAEDKQTFSVSFQNIVRPIEFDFVFVDRDNVKGRRRILIRAIDDRAPEVFDVEMTAVLRKPRFKSDAGQATPSAGVDGFLVTPDALVPFKGTLRDDYGLTDADWRCEVEPVEFELVGRSAGEKLSGPVLKAETRVRLIRMVTSGLQFAGPLPGLEVPGIVYAAGLVGAARNEIARSGPAVPREQVFPLERFKSRLEERAGDEVPLNALAEKLRDKPPQRGLLKEHLLKEENGFDFKAYLPVLKTKEPTKQAQLHYRVRLSVTATDNNVETGPGVGRSKMPFTFLVVSETELLAQIFLEEELLRERLEKVVGKLKNARTFVNEQASKLSNPDFDLALVALRVDEVRKILADTSSGTREIHGDYARILRELEANRVGWDRGKKKIEDVRTKIVEPLEEIVNPNNGSFDLADRAVTKLFEGLDEEASRLRGVEEDKNALEKMKQQLAAGRPQHVENAQNTRDRLDTLIEGINRVLLAMDEGIAFGQLLQIILTLERDQRQAAERLLRMQRQKEKELFDSIINPGSK